MTKHMGTFCAEGMAHQEITEVSRRETRSQRRHPRISSLNRYLWLLGWLWSHSWSFCLCLQNSGILCRPLPHLVWVSRLFCCLFFCKHFYYMFIYLCCVSMGAHITCVEVKEQFKGVGSSFLPCGFWESNRVQTWWQLFLPTKSSRWFSFVCVHMLMNTCLSVCTHMCKHVCGGQRSCAFLNHQLLFEPGV